jgi:hypothetical protein
MVPSQWSKQMASKKRKYRQKMKVDLYENYDDYYDEDFDINDISKDFYSTERDYYVESDDRMTARRKIERREDLKNLYSQLDDFEEFGEPSGW